MLLLAAQAFVDTEHLADVSVTSSRNSGHVQLLLEPLLLLVHSGTFTNHIQAAFREPRLPVVTDPTVDHQPLTVVSSVNLPIISLCNTDSPLCYVDISIPCNNNRDHSVRLMW
ncbi:hypothetical protein GH733_003238 [Mirounga leonina]|nr:hypothetical protein GH733_003238 [Mirounga leonina]